MKKSMIFRQDFPDPDVIRVGNSYYLVSTTMHFMPGATLLKSNDLIHWEIHSHVFDQLENTPGHWLEDQCDIYGQGMWAPSFRYHKGVFYLCFSANDTQKTYLFRTKDINGPWQYGEIEGFYHDSSLFFDEDDRVYLVYGNSKIYLIELEGDLTRPKHGSVPLCIVQEADQVILGYEGSHMYKVDGRYYLFLIHWLAEGTKRRVEVCFRSDKIDGPYEGKKIFDEDLGYHNQGIAQGGIVQDTEGLWYGFMFQDSGAVGRVPVRVPVRFEQGWPVMSVEDKVPLEVMGLAVTGAEMALWDLNDDFEGVIKHGKRVPKAIWQWNHRPDPKGYCLEKNHYQITTRKICPTILQASNTLTQRCTAPLTIAEVTLDGSNLLVGDFAGISAFQGTYSFLALTRTKECLALQMRGKNWQSLSQPTPQLSEGEILYKHIQIDKSQIKLRMTGDFGEMRDIIRYDYWDGSKWVFVGEAPHRFTLDHFTGCRVALFMYSTVEKGGSCAFSAFRYQ